MNFLKVVFFRYLPLLLVSCTAKVPSDQWMLGGEEKVKVLATTAMIGDLARQIGGDLVDVTILIQGEIDPHSYEMKKGDAEKFDRANLILYNGLGLEHGASLASRLKNDPKAVAVSQAIVEKSSGELIYVDHTIDPHIWMDLHLWSQTTITVAEALIKLRPEAKEEIQKRSDELMRGYLVEDQMVYDKMQGIPADKRYLVTSHDAFRYYGKRYLATDPERDANTWQMRVMAPEGLAPEGQVSLIDIQNLVSHLKEYGIDVVFPESNISAASLKKIVDVCRKQGVDIRIAKEPLYGDVLGPSGSDADTLGKMVEHNTKIISFYLGENHG